jgi:hypothetical protein
MMNDRGVRPAHLDEEHENAFRIGGLFRKT